MQNQKKPIQQKKPMQNFTAEKWADKIALFIDNFGFLSGFFWHWTIALPSPTSHLAMLHSKIILSDPNRRVKVVLIGFSLFWSRCRTWGTKSSRDRGRQHHSSFAKRTPPSSQTREEVPPPFAIQQASWGAERRWTTWQEEPEGGWRSAWASRKIFGSLSNVIVKVLLSK